MRIIAGELGGRPIKSPPGKGTRPMLARVREALFSTLTPEVPEARVLDLFSGTGSLGLEALSRGAGSACLIEQDWRTAKLLRQNVATFELEDRADVVCGDALAAELWGVGPWDIVFLDPPYPMVKDASGFERVHAALTTLLEGALAPDGVCVLHAPRGQVRAMDLPEGYDATLKEYGTQALWYLRPGGNA